ncbi:hypothetical protein BFW38_10125 [Terasakiispira papahanaumokuakeensis]|uniref:Uncharacterized protein n=1 Tax=Terasakiispira papahanaumokuakeensis TaxID=197479 RepID=A0A1E2VA04_9GAMM|nr:hypothetical protein [Terasakiispira papahanaumokuakeensis]ODC03848.1 hypothetical protein BFW38_10125 [Terasakiispira papahanaumokuakeensis]
MPRFKHDNDDQNQLQPGTFEYAVDYLIEHKLDLSIFYPKYRNDPTQARRRLFVAALPPRQRRACWRALCALTPDTLQGAFRE